VSYIRNGIRVSEYGGLIHGVLYWRGGGGLYLEVYGICFPPFLSN
jgi:hypothetical protein